jgi:addiction module RelE/StbE family toxin
MGKVVIWSKQSLKQLESIHEYILEETGSLTLVDKVIDKILKSSQILSKQPEMHPPDSHKLNNNGNYRAYEIYSYRIAYPIMKENVRILRVRHTSREPLKY